MFTADSVKRSEGFVSWDDHGASFTAANSLRKKIPINQHKRKKKEKKKKKKTTMNEQTNPKQTAKTPPQTLRPHKSIPFIVLNVFLL